jgi:hypothetical protein
MEEAINSSGGHPSPPFKTSQIISLKRSNLGKEKKRKKNEKNRGFTGNGSQKCFRIWFWMED